MRIAAIPYHPQPFPGWVAHEAKLLGLLEGLEADLVILPEYAAMEAAMVGGAHGLTELEWRDLAADRAGDWVEQWRLQAQRHVCHILAGSGPVRTEAGIVNRAWLIAPSGAVAHQDKLILTPYERETLQMVPGNALQIFDTALGKIGILICYDSEFPILAHALCAAGAEMLLVPSCTDFPAGQTRVRQSARARAIENQCLVVQVPLVGETRCSIVDQSTGRAGFFAPPDHGLPANGILCQGETDRAEPLLWEGDPAAIAAPRQTGQVGNFAHWPEQESHSGPVETLTLR